jgi:hypothetical protein
MSTQAQTSRSRAIWAALFAAVCVAACTRLDEPADSKRWDGYAKGQKFVLRHNCFLAKVSDGTAGARFALLPPGEFWNPAQIHSSPKSVAAWRRVGTNDYPDVVGVVPGGTAIECCRLRTDRGWHWFVGAYCISTVFASICDGEYAGTEVDLTDLSVFGNDRTRSPYPFAGAHKPDRRSVFANFFVEKVPFTNIVADDECPPIPCAERTKNGNPDFGGFERSMLYLYPAGPSC